jgi:hypothetical protein
MADYVACSGDWPAAAGRLEAFIAGAGKLVLDTSRGEGAAQLATRRQQVAMAQYAARQAVDELRSAVHYARLMRCSARIVFDATLMIDTHYYDGFVFQCVLERSPAGKDDTIVAGGRYDALLRLLSSASSKRHNASLPGAVGFTIAVDKLAADAGVCRCRPRASSLLRRACSRPRRRLRCRATLPRSADALVCSSGLNMLEHRIEVAALLWQRGIRATFEHAADATIDELAEHCRTHGIPLLLWLRDRAFASSAIVRVRRIPSAKFDVDVQLRELVDVVCRALTLAVTPPNANVSLDKLAHAQTAVLDSSAAAAAAAASAAALDASKSAAALGDDDDDNKAATALMRTQLTAAAQVDLSIPPPWAFFSTTASGVATVGDSLTASLGGDDAASSEGGLATPYKKPACRTRCRATR